MYNKYTKIPMIPGPVSVHPDILSIMNKDYGAGQLDDNFLLLYRNTEILLQKINEFSGDFIIMTGEGMIALWGALKSVIHPRDKVYSIVTGVFGDGIGDMAVTAGAEVKKYSIPFDKTISYADFEKIEKEIKIFNPKLITLVHCETPSGTLNPIKEIGEIKKRLNIPLLYVDAVSSMGGVSIRGDQWHIDLLLGGTQKCFSCPPNLGLIGVSSKAWDIILDVNYGGYDALKPFKNIYQVGRPPYTPYWHGIAALNCGLNILFNEGLDSVFCRHQNVSEKCINLGKNLGLILFTSSDAVNSPTVTAFNIPASFTWQQWNKNLCTKGLYIAGSFGPMSGKIFRLGHMGTQADNNLIEQAFEVISSVLSGGV